MQNWSTFIQLDLNDSFLFDQEARPLNPTTLSLEAADLTGLDFLMAVGFFPLEVEGAFLEVFALDDDFDTWTARLEDFAGVDASLPFLVTLFFEFGVDSSLAFLVILFFWFEILTDLTFVRFCSVIRDLAMSLRTLSTVSDSKLSFFLKASSIRVANVRSLLATKLVTFPVKDKDKLSFENLIRYFWPPPSKLINHHVLRISLFKTAVLMYIWREITTQM